MMNSTKSLQRREMRLVAIMVTMLFSVAVAIGAGISWVFFLRSFDPQFDALRETDLRLGQRIYNETVARFLKDMALMQEQTRLQALLDLDVLTRQTEHATINETIINETEARAAGDLNLTYGIGNETAARLASDVLIQIQIDNSTTYLTQIQAFDALSTQYFMTLMMNVSTIYNGTTDEIAARQSNDTTLFAQDAIFDSTLVTLVNIMTQETANRTAIDAMIRFQLQEIANGLILNINGQFPVLNNMVLSALNSPRVTVTNGTNQVIITSPGITTFNSLATGNDVVFIGANGLLVDSPSANAVRLSFPLSSPVATNLYQFSTVYPFGSEFCAYQGCYNAEPNCHPSNSAGVFVRKNDAFDNPCIIDNPKCVFLFNCEETATGNWCVGPCFADSDCTAVYGSQWVCDKTLTYPGGGMCRHNGGCSLNGNYGPSSRDESQCADLPQLGADQWQCYNDRCRMRFCQYSYECQNELGADYTCFNGRCIYGTFTGGVSGLNNGMYDPATDARTPSVIVSTWQMTPNDGDGLCTCCCNADCPQLNTQGIAGPAIYSNAEPWTGYGLPCGFGSFQGQDCGFRMPIGYDSSWMVRVTVNMRVSWDTYLAYGEHFWQLLINRGSGWEPIRGMCTSSFDQLQGPGGDANIGIYVSMSSTIFMTSISNLPYAQGQYLFVGWSMLAGVIPAGNINHVPGVTYYEIVYQATQVF